MKVIRYFLLISILISISIVSASKDNRAGIIDRLTELFGDLFGELFGGKKGNNYRKPKAFCTIKK